MNVLEIIVVLVLVLLIIVVVYDFIAARKRNRNKFGSDFLFDTIDRGANTSNDKTLDEHNLKPYPFDDKYSKKLTGLKKNKNNRL